MRCVHEVRMNYNEPQWSGLLKYPLLHIRSQMSLNEELKMILQVKESWRYSILSPHLAEPIEVSCS